MQSAKEEQGPSIRELNRLNEMFELRLGERAVDCQRGASLDVAGWKVFHVIRADRVASRCKGHAQRSEEHTSELQSLMRISYAVFCLKKKNNINRNAASRTR